MIAGLEVQENWLQNQLSFDTNPDALYLQDARDSHRIGVYLQDDIAVTGQLRLSLGARLDDYSLVSNALFSPRVGLIYQPFPETTLRLQYGQAFRAPNVAQQFQAYAPIKSDENGDGIAETLSSRGLLANPSLRSEQIKTYELGLEQTLAKHWRFTATGYYMNLDKLISIQTVNDDFEQQTNKQTNKQTPTAKPATAANLKCAGNGKTAFCCAPVTVCNSLEINTAVVCLMFPIIFTS